MREWIAVFALLLAFAAQANAQQSDKKDDDMQGMPGMGGMQMDGMNMGGTDLITMQPETFIQEIVRHAGSGTSAEPNSTPVPMLMKMKGKWALMFHANAFAVETQQSSARGGDKFFSTNWLMGMAQRPAGPGVFTARAMLSLEPATITGRQYPLLFQQGETAFGVPIADGQHPHNFFMELAVLYDLKLGSHALLSFYAAPIGDPAIGPMAYPHRASASEDPLATLGHHQEDSTHIAEDVVTTGVTYRFFRIEASGFHGGEPDENRWNLNQGNIDSWSTRLTLQPGKNWSGQYSYARISSPEALFPNENQERMIASVMYNRPLHEGNWASSLIWGRTKSIEDHSIFDSYTLESTLRFLSSNYAWIRIENAERSNGLLLGESFPPPNFQEQPIARVQAYTIGYDREINLIPHIASAIGAQATVYGVGENLKPVYGSHPVGVAVFLRLRPISGQER
ncbi:MAG TPA: hypothetical protein VGI34_09110 [Candidatus Acidoferrales bacterium]|jgi:hypothetical protein